MDVLIAESGGTKTDWLGFQAHRPPRQMKCEGLNPNLTQWRTIQERLQQFANLHALDEIDQLFFFGAGLGTAQNLEQMTTLIKSVLKTTKRVIVADDLKAAALATLGFQPGYTCILGTGSVAIKFDGKKVASRRGGLGYLLEDDGSGSRLGQVFLKKLLNNQLEPSLVEKHDHFFNCNHQKLRQKIYQSKNPVEQFTNQIPFLSQERLHPQVREILTHQFNLFISYTLKPLLNESGQPIIFMGGISREFEDLIVEIGRTHQLELSCLKAPPIFALAKNLLGELTASQHLNRANTFFELEENALTPAYKSLG